MKKNLTAIIFTLIVIIVIGGIAFAIRQSAAESKKLEPFAQCVNDSGAKFYGAYWCPHCNQQKALFGRAHKALPYIECSTPGGDGQTEVCQEEEIQSYPTWKFPDETVLSGVVTLEVLAAQTGCQLPGEDNVGSVQEVGAPIVEDSPVLEAETIEEVAIELE